MSDMIRSGGPHIPKVQTSEVKVEKEQISKSLDSFWKPIVDFFKMEDELEEKVLQAGIHNVIDSYKAKELSLKESINIDSPTGKNLNILS